MSHELDSLDDFLKHRTSDRGSSFLKGWKKDGHIVVFLHMKVRPIALWVHSVPKIFLKEEDGEDAVRRVFGGEFNCHEDEATLKAQYKRDRDGVRLKPPKSCPLCILIETVRDMVDEGQLSFTQTLFKFEADNPKETRVIHAGGVYNHFGRDDLTKEEKRLMAAAGINASEAWNENMQAKGKYAFFVVNADKPEDGVQLATEAGSLGDAVKDVIADSMDSAKKPELGNPFVHPFAIKWIYNESEKVFSKKYRALKFERMEPTDEILALIQGDKPDTSSVIKPFDVGAMRTMLERACLVRDKLPWDHIFGKARAPKQEDMDDSPSDDTSVDEGVTISTGHRVASDKDADFPHGHNVPAARERVQQHTIPKPTPVVGSDEMVACDHCPQMMRLSDPACPGCGFVYVETATPPAPRPRKRSEVAR